MHDVIRPTSTVVEEDPRIRNDSRSDTGDNDGSNGGSQNQRSDASMPNALNTDPQPVKDTNEDGKLVLPAMLWGTRGGPGPEPSVPGRDGMADYLLAGRDEQGQSLPGSIEREHGVVTNSRGIPIPFWPIPIPPGPEMRQLKSLIPNSGIREAVFG